MTLYTRETHIRYLIFPQIQVNEKISLFHEFYYANYISLKGRPCQRVFVNGRILWQKFNNIQWSMMEVLGPIMFTGIHSKQMLLLPIINTSVKLNDLQVGKKKPAAQRVPSECLSPTIMSMASARRSPIKSAYHTFHSLFKSCTVRVAAFILILLHLRPEYLPVLRPFRLISPFPCPAL